MTVRGTDPATEPRDVVSDEVLAIMIYNSIVQSAPGCGDDLQRLLRAAGRLSWSFATAIQIPIVAQIMMALEAVEIEDTYPRRGKKMATIILGLAERQLGSDEEGREFFGRIATGYDELSRVAKSGGNPYRHAAGMLLSRLKISPDLARHLAVGNWLDYWAHIFIGNCRVGRTLLGAYQETDDGWLRVFRDCYQPCDPEQIGQCVYGEKIPEELAPVSPVLARLLAVRLAPDDLVIRPSATAKQRALLAASIVGDSNCRPMLIGDGLVDAGLRDKLQRHRRNPRYVEMLFSAMDLTNYDLVRGPDLFPDTSQPGNAVELEPCRERVLGELRRGDVILTAAPANELSRQIRQLDDGAWSHVLVVMDGRKVFDAQLSGMTETDVGKYLEGKHRFAHCRLLDQGTSPKYREDWAAEEMMRALRAKIGQPYWIGGALRAALNAWLSRRVKPGAHATPNAIAYQGGLVPLTVW